MNDFSESLQEKVDILLKRAPKRQLGRIAFNSPLLLAPMSSICNAPFRLLMEKLGAGGTISELISCHGINYGNEKTLRMLRIDPEEEAVGIQIFGEDPEAMAKAAKVAETYGPKFIDINMGCPVRKVVSKGGGSALMKDPKKLGHYFKSIKEAIKIPLTVKIRTGWDESSINAPEVIRIAHEEGLEFVSVHGRTRAQQCTGQANWNFLEQLAIESPLPIIGNGDLHTATSTQERMEQTNCQALMLGRGPLRYPFIFLESFKNGSDNINFSPLDYLEIIYKLLDYSLKYIDEERVVVVQMRKHIMWMSAGFEGASKFRGEIFKYTNIDQLMKITDDYFTSIESKGFKFKRINHEETFMSSGHG